MKKKTTRQFLGEVLIDSGVLLIADACNLENPEPDANVGQPAAAPIPWELRKKGQVQIFTPCGDGRYPVFLECNRGDTFLTIKLTNPF